MIYVSKVTTLFSKYLGVETVVTIVMLLGLGRKAPNPACLKSVLVACKIKSLSLEGKEFKE